MTNKELFNLLSENQKRELVEHLGYYNKCHIEFYRGEYHITSNYTLLGKYPSDYKCYENEFTTEEFYNKKVDFNTQWYYFIHNREDEDGYKLNQEFKEVINPIVEEALRNY